MVSGFNHLEIFIFDGSLSVDNSVDVTEQVNPIILENNKPIKLVVHNMTEGSEAVFCLVMSKTYINTGGEGQAIYFGLVSNSYLILSYDSGRWILAMGE